MEGHRLRGRRQLGQPHLDRQGVALGRAVQFAVREQQGQLLQAQDVVAQGILVDAQAPHAPGVGMEGVRRLVQARLMVAVLLLEMLRAKKQPLAP
jgi:hypothetical protein